MPRSFLLLWALSALVACGRGRTGAADPSSACAPTEDTLAAVSAQVLDATTLRPVADASVLTDPWAGQGNALGFACVEEVRAGVQDVRAERLGYVTERVRVTLTAGRALPVTFHLRRAERPCCRLQGSWRVRFDPASPVRGGAAPRGGPAEGEIVFDRRLPNPLPDLYSLSDPYVRYEFGRHEVDLGPIGGISGRGGSTTGSEPEYASLLHEAVGLVPVRDSVWIGLIPRLSHGGVSFSGRIRGDTIRGRWSWHSHSGSASGPFTMWRTRWDSGFDAMVRRGVASFEREMREVLAADEARLRRAGALRLRTYDVARIGYVHARYWVSSLGDTAGLSMTGDSGEDGWGDYLSLEPGRYEVVLSEYPCGGEMISADERHVRSRLPRVEITVRTGDRREVTTRIDSRTIKAAPSYNNVRGEACVP